MAAHANAAARLDRLPIGSFHRRALRLVGMDMFFAGMDTNQRSLEFIGPGRRPVGGSRACDDPRRSRIIGSSPMTNTPFERIWDQHVIKDYGDGRALIHIDRHFAQEGTSGRAFDGLRQRGLKVRRRI